MSDYTPTTEQVRTDYILAYSERESSQVLAARDFDRWLAEHDRQVKAEALRWAAQALPFPADPYGGFDHESLRAAQVQHANWLREVADR